jgi:hypothetical protein
MGSWARYKLWAIDAGPPRPLAFLPAAGSTFGAATFESASGVNTGQSTSASYHSMNDIDPSSMAVKDSRKCHTRPYHVQAGQADARRKGESAAESAAEPVCLAIAAAAAGPRGSGCVAVQCTGTCSVVAGSLLPSLCLE